MDYLVDDAVASATQFFCDLVIIPLQVVEIGADAVVFLVLADLLLLCLLVFLFFPCHQYYN